MFRRCTALLFVCLAHDHAPLVAGDAPNIVLIVADDLGYGETGCQGNDQIPTPHIDSIAETGVRFTSGYVTAAYCSASRAGFLTGRYQTRFGHEFNPTGAHNEDPAAGLPVKQVTLADRLHDVGYTTGLVGKWHLGGTAAYHPYRRGFDEFFGFLHEGHYFVPPPYDGVVTMLRRKRLPGNQLGRWISVDGRMVYGTHMGRDEPDYDADNPIYRGGQPVVETEYLTDALTREATSFITRNADRPFFLYLAYNAVHSPLQGADAYMKRFAGIDDIHRRIFAAMLSNMDDSVGHVLAALQQQQLSDNTIVIFLSDNGGPTRELTSSNAPLRGEKGSMYEGGLRVPFLMKWPGQIPAGATYDPPVISLDISATALQAAGVKVPTDADGVNLLPFLNGTLKERPHTTLYWRTGRKGALRHGDWKLVRNPGRGQSADWQLYDLAKDMAETTDLSGAAAAVRSDLIRRWEALDAEMIDAVWPVR
ncbi:MAG: sulfatase-like hydrolase/transferase [Planctomycetaceae bacterium]|nr:sulfatase-like hydrolase/transferase [Planctomycetaceae bacterium]